MKLQSVDDMYTHKAAALFPSPDNAFPVAAMPNDLGRSMGWAVVPQSFLENSDELDEEEWNSGDGLDPDNHVEGQFGALSLTSDRFPSLCDTSWVPTRAPTPNWEQASFARVPSSGVNRKGQSLVFRQEAEVRDRRDRRHNSGSTLRRQPYRAWTSEISTTTYERGASLLACPYYKRDPVASYECRRYKFQRVKDVKQHLYRRHSRPDGIRMEQKKALSHNVTRGKTVPEQWYDMWEILFPGLKRPRSVYLGSVFEQSILQIRSSWISNRSQIIHKVLSTDSFMSIPLESMFDRVVQGLLDCFEDDTNPPLASTDPLSLAGKESPSSDDSRSMDGNSYPITRIAALGDHGCCHDTSHDEWPFSEEAFPHDVSNPLPKSNEGNPSSASPPTRFPSEAEEIQGSNADATGGNNFDVNALLACLHEEDGEFLDDAGNYQLDGLDLELFGDSY